MVGDRIVFKFNPPFGEGFGTYVGLVNMIIWNDGGHVLNEARKIRGESYDDLDLSQWAIVASKPTLTIPEYRFAAHAQRAGRRCDF